MCVKAVSTDVNSSLLMGTLRTCPWILLARVALGDISKAWQKDGQRCEALCRVSGVLPMLAASFWREHLVERAQWRAVANPSAAGSGCGGSVG